MNDSTEKKEGTRLSVYAALAGNLLVTATKTIAAVLTGSSAMLSEAVHSFVDTGNELLLLYGMHRASRRPDAEHPLGYGRELYFWSFVVALMVFALGAGVSIYQGILHVRSPQAIANPLVSYVVLAFAFLFEGGSWLVSVRQFNAAKGDLGYYEAFRRSKDPPLFMVLFEDTAALLGIVIAAIGTFAATSLGAPEADGVASVLIGLMLAVTASLLARESKSLLIGERADRDLSASIMRIAESQKPAVRANGLMTVQMAPDQIVVALSLEFTDSLRAPDIEDYVLHLERAIRDAHPDVVALFVKPQTEKTFRDGAGTRFADPGMDGAAVTGPALSASDPGNLGAGN